MLENPNKGEFMPDIFIMIIKKMQEIGAFNFMFPYILTSAVFYGLIRKSQIFGEPDKNVAVNAVVSLVAAFMVWAYPILTGVDIETQLATFFTHGLVVTLVFMMGLIITGMFFKPNLPEQFSLTFLQGNKAAIILVVGIVVGIVVFVTSGLLNLIIGPIIPKIPTDALLAIGMLILLIVPFVLIIRGGGGKEETEEGEGD